MLKYPALQGCKILLGLLLLFAGQALQAQDINYARTVVNTLASPAYKGRGYFGDGAELASSFIAAEFKKAGVIPLNDGSYFQPFNISVNTFPGRVELTLNKQQLTTAKDYLIDASSPSLTGKFKVYPLSRADLLDQQTLIKQLQLAQEAFLLIDNRPVENESAADKATADQILEQLNTAPELKLKGIIIYSTAKLTWTTLPFQGPRMVIFVNKPDLDPASINEINLAVDAKFVPDFVARNVTGMIKGRSQTDSTIVITAHYDHLGMLGNNVYLPGANDNASGVAMLLKFVKHYAKTKPKYNTVFLAFSGEEIGLLGSKAFVEKPLVDLQKIRFLVNFDLAGTGEEGIKVVNGSIFKEKFEKLVTLNKEYKLLPKVDIRGAACNSDHCWFYEKGVPSFFIYTQGGISAYHDIYDRPETLPLTAFVPFFQLMTKFFAQL
jgi:aminopeptidase YwaD